MRARSLPLLATPLAALCVFSLVFEARASDLDGTWHASALVERWSIGDWGEACGPRPAPQGAPGGVVTVKDSGGELTISGAGRTWRTTKY